ncbi:MAG TPA: hypothetical protein VK203_12910, partial [Nostocaceae cyanobacterium]|nr:hypothetical protein [Nostocaceae cyanobacterium]
MAENQGMGSGFNLPEEQTQIPEIGIKNPLLSHSPLGQKLISPKFLSPLGAKSLSNFDPSVFTPTESSSDTQSENPYQNSPFFPEYRSQQISASPSTTNNINTPAIQTKIETNNSTLSSEALAQTIHIVDHQSTNTETPVLQRQVDSVAFAENTSTNTETPALQRQVDSTTFTESSNSSIDTSKKATNVTANPSETPVIQTQTETNNSKLSSEPFTQTGDNVNHQSLDVETPIVQRQTDSTTFAETPVLQRQVDSTTFTESSNSSIDTSKKATNVT